MSVSNSSYRELTDISFTNISSSFLIISVQSFDLCIRTRREMNFLLPLSLFPFYVKDKCLLSTQLCCNFSFVLPFLSPSLVNRMKSSVRLT